MSSRSGPATGNVLPIVDVVGLTKTYRSWSLSGRRTVRALDEVTVRAFAGEVFGLLGPNGAGKTTLIKTLLGVIQPTSGTASLFGLPAGASEARRRVGYLPESLRIDGHHTARTALRFYGRLSRLDERTITRRTAELLELVGLRDRDQESVRRFSKGMGQRLGLAQALMHEPDLLILDEPTDGLDPVGRNEVRRIIERLREAGKTIFLNSHILQEVELVCSQVAIMAEGRIRGSGTLDELAQHQQGERLILDIELRDTSPSNPIDAAVTDSLLTSLHPCFAPAVIDMVPLGHFGRYRLSAWYRDQGQVDAAVDVLRERGISLVSLRSHRPSLEETFLRLVAPLPTESPSAVGDGNDELDRSAHGQNEVGP